MMPWPAVSMCSDGSGVTRSGGWWPAGPAVEGEPTALFRVGGGDRAGQGEQCLGQSQLIGLHWLRHTAGPATVPNDG